MLFNFSISRNNYYRSRDTTTVKSTGFEITDLAQAPTLLCALACPWGSYLMFLFLRRGEEQRKIMKELNLTRLSQYTENTSHYSDHR